MQYCNNQQKKNMECWFFSTKTEKGLWPSICRQNCNIAINFINIAISFINLAINFFNIVINFINIAINFKDPPLPKFFF